MLWCCVAQPSNSPPHVPPLLRQQQPTSPAHRWVCDNKGVDAAEVGQEACHLLLRIMYTRYEQRHLRSDRQRVGVQAGQLESVAG